MTGNYGTARLGDTFDLALNGMLRPGGLPVGRGPAVSVREALRFLRAAPAWASEDACRVMLAALARRRLPVWVRRGTHTAIFAPAGKGKSTGLVIPYLLTCPDAAVVIDIKGELYRATAGHRERAFGHHVVALDPFKVVTERPDTLNPLAAIDPRDLHALDDVRSVAEALVKREKGDDQATHFNDLGEMSIGAFTAFALATFSDPTLNGVAAVLASPEAFQKAKAEMRSSRAYAGGLALMGDQLAHCQDRELGSMLTTCARHLRFLTTAAVAASTATSSFDPRELAGGKLTVYLVLPPDRLAAMSGLLRLWVTALLRAVVRTGLDDGKNVRFILDESASIGQLDAIENAITQMRGYGLRMLFAYQSLGQLKKVYPEGQDQTFLSNMDTQVFFGVNDYETAEYVSKRIGSTTVVNLSVNAGDSASVNRDPNGLPSHSGGWNRGRSAQEGERVVLRPEQVLQLNDAVVFTPGVPPLLTTLVRYFDRGADAVLRQPGRSGLLVRSLLAGLLAVGAGVGGSVGLRGWQAWAAEQKRLRVAAPIALPTVAPPGGYMVPLGPPQDPRAGLGLGPPIGHPAFPPVVPHNRGFPRPILP